MKMRSICFFMFFGILISASSCSYAQSNSTVAKSINFIKEFYTIYINKISGKSPPNGKFMYSLEKKYCSVRFLAKIKDEDLDEDPFIRAQDCDLSWVKTLSVNKEDGKENIYIVSYLDKQSGKKTIIHVVLVQNNNVFQIDNIW